MRPTNDLVYESSTAIELGRRERQEDAVVSDFSTGQPVGFVVLSDGMGGHAAGDVASKIVVTEVFAELKLQSSDPEQFESHIGEVLRRAALSANRCVGVYARTCPDAHGMGATLLAPVLIGDRLYWVSIGDSPLYLFRNGTLTRLNENHALFSQVDYLVANGIMGRDEIRNHPDKNCLTSVLIGRDIPQVDCRTVPVRLLEGDILIAASDGLQFLQEERISDILRLTRICSAEEIVTALVGEIQTLDDPWQDNISLCAIKVNRKDVTTQTDPPQTSATAPQGQTAGANSITILAKAVRTGKATG